jgi:archaellum component FlaC
MSAIFTFLSGNRTQERSDASEDTEKASGNPSTPPMPSGNPATPSSSEMWTQQTLYEAQATSWMFGMQESLNKIEPWIAHGEQQIGDLNKKIEEQEESKNEIRSSIDSLKQEIADLEQEIARLNTDNASDQKQISELIVKDNDLQAAINSLKMQVVDMGNQQTADSQTIIDLGVQIQQLTQANGKGKWDLVCILLKFAPPIIFLGILKGNGINVDPMYGMMFILLYMLIVEFSYGTIKLCSSQQGEGRPNPSNGLPENDPLEYNTLNQSLLLQQ